MLVPLGGDSLPVGPFHSQSPAHDGLAAALAIRSGLEGFAVLRTADAASAASIIRSSLSPGLHLPAPCSRPLCRGHACRTHQGKPAATGLGRMRGRSNCL